MKIQAHIIGNIISSNSQEAFTIFNKSRLGERKNDKVQYSLCETLYLIEKGKMELLSKNKKIPEKEVMKKFQKIDKKIQTKYPVFRDLRNKGYLVKSALKFGSDFRVYEKNTKKENHAKWVVFTDHESNKLTWHDFSAKNRIAHSTKKKLLLAIVDEEESITYYEVGWVRP